MKNPVWCSDRRIQVSFFALAVILYLPGIWWGLPHATAPDRVLPWGSDELAPLGPIAELYSVLTRSSKINPQYPLFHYVVQAFFVVPYLLWLWLTGKLANPSVNYPYGLSDPVSALATMTLLARATSLIMAAGVVVVAYKTATVLWDRRTGMIAGLLVLLMYPMVYYSRTSNVDMGALFWTSLGLAVFATSLRDRLTLRRAAWLGLFAGLATATKDASYAAFGVMGAILVFRQISCSWNRPKGSMETWKPFGMGLLVAASVYMVASGILFKPERFFLHIQFIMGATHAFVYPNSLQGYLGLLGEVVDNLVDSLGLLTVLCAGVGIILCYLRTPSRLAFGLPALGILAGTILPIHYVLFRYVMMIAYILPFFSAYALSVAFISKQPSVRKIAGIFLAVVCVWSLIRDADLTYQMIEDSRYELAAWFRENAKPGDRVGLFGAAQKLPALEAGVISVSLERWCSREAWESAQAPEFVVVIPQQHFEMIHEWSLPETIYQRLDDGSLGYQRIVRLQTRSLFSRRPVSFVNPPVQVFVKKELHPVLVKRDGNVGPVKPLLDSLEKAFNMQAKRPPGLVRNLERRPDRCQAEMVAKSAGIP
jgi:hypothetical protein